MTAKDWFIVTMLLFYGTVRVVLQRWIIKKRERGVNEHKIEPNPDVTQG